MADLICSHITLNKVLPGFQGPSEVPSLPIYVDNSDFIIESLLKVSKTPSYSFSSVISQFHSSLVARLITASVFGKELFEF